MANYFNGSLSEDQVKKLQGFYGVDVDGKWGPQSTDAAFGMSADEAWEIYTLEAEPEKEKDPWKPEPPRVEKPPAISEPVEDADYSEGWEDDEPITKPTEVWDDDYDWTKDDEPETKQSPVPPVDPVDTYKPTSYGWEQVEDVDYSEGWDDEPEPVQTPKPPKTTKATPVVDEPVEGVDYFEGREDDEPEPVQTPKTIPAVKTEEKPVVNTTPRGNGFGNNRHGSGFSQTTEEATPDPRDRLAEINKELEDLDDTNGFFDVSPYSEEEQRERENRITELKQERDEITALLGKERKEEKAAAEAAKQAQIAEIDREIKDTEDQLAALAKRTDMDAYSKRLESEKLKARRAELVRAKIDVDPSLADRIWAGLGNIFTTSAGGFSAVGDVIKDVLTGKADARGYDANSRSAQYFDYANEAKERALSGTTGAGRALGEAGLAIGQTLSTLPLNVVPGGSLVAMGITSAGQKMDEVKRQGGTSGEAFLRGGVTGMIEGATEAIPLGALFDLAKYGGTSAVKSVLKQAGIEATEEAVAYVLNFAADKLARDPNAAFSWSELAKAAAMGGFSGGVMGTGATAVYHANHYDGGRANLLTPEEIAAYNEAEQERIQQEELFAEIERDWYENEETPAHTEETEDDWDDLFDEEDLFALGARQGDELQSILKRSTIKTPGGFSCFPDGDVLNQNVQAVIPEKDHFDVAMHGGIKQVGFGSKELNMSPKTLADIIRHSEGYHGQSIRLLSCSTGKSVDGDYCFAEELANALGVEVTAPNMKLYIGKNGKLKVGYYGEGTFVPFTPNQRRRIK